MKEFALRHPFLTFFMVDGAFTCIQNCVAMITGRKDGKKERAAANIMNKACETAEDISKVVSFKEVKNESDNAGK